MNRLTRMFVFPKRTWTLWILTFVLVVSAGRSSDAAYPPYLILTSPGSYVRHGHVWSGGYAIEVPAQRYSWGYFGAAPRHHWSHHHGYYSNYTQWTSR